MLMEGKLLGVLQIIERAIVWQVKGQGQKHFKKSGETAVLNLSIT